ncbi:phenylethanolamine N-methyltransferase-like [Gigantopelta aegis]|uniref:phenylethanolamine N-methyltransferase-like n=1 Tax=Gigantopelta aegis TaxID=1735272 RepID=UPI001B888565|nr:phenylethanolamine N-methyltransferase-like [Gigantopelta aegis]XP_041362458.1 phenylethanolamine N-methyltransferase-like [Gigantopelta aegis]
MALLHGTDYCDKFSPEIFLKDFWGYLDDQNIFTISNAYIFLNDERLTGHRLLDFGCGPSLSGMITTPERFSDIVMADLAPSNLDIIRRWMDGEKINFNWDHIFRFTAELAGAKDVSEWTERKIGHLKTFVKKLVTCDVTKELPLGPDYVEAFDVVFTSFCLATAAKSIAEYKQFLKHVASLLPSGGHLVMRDTLNLTAYTVHNKKFHFLKLSMVDVKDALCNAQFEVLECKSENFSMPLCEPPELSVFVLLARKA